MSDWKQEILAGIGPLSRVGTPGCIEITGTNVAPILSGGGSDQVVIAAGLLGQGRVIVAGHDGYAEGIEDVEGRSQDPSIARLQSNMKRWLSSSSPSNRIAGSDLEIAVIGDASYSHSQALLPGRIVVWRGSAIDWSEQEVQEVLSLVRAGGAFLHAMCPWGWLQLNPDKTLQDMPFYELLDELGARYTTNYVDSTLSGPRETDAWKNEMTRGMSALPCLGTPGVMVVYGDYAEPIVCDSERAVIVAAAELGRGRVVALSHSGYVEDLDSETGNKDPTIQRLQNNIKQWLSSGIDASPAGETRNVRVIGHRADIRKGKDILVWHGDNIDLSESDVTDVITHVTCGGSFVYAICPWGWLQLHPGKRLETLPFHRLLEEVGLCYTPEYAEGGAADGFDVTEDAGSAHLGRVFSQLAAGQCALLETHEKVIARVRFVPEAARMELDAKCGNLLERCTKDIQTCYPCKQRPVKDSKSKSVMALYSSLSDAHHSCDKMPGVASFPGDIPSPPLSCIEVQIESLTVDVHPTGYYLPAGAELEVTLIDREGSQGTWSIQIGAHSDDLYDQDELRRWPLVIQNAPIDGDVTCLSSRYGGLVYLLSPDGRAKLNVRIRGVTEAPYFDLTDNSSSSVEQWRTRRNAPGVWADMCGEFIIFTVPSGSVRLLEDPSDVLQTWDRVVQAHHHLRGTDIRRQRRQWVVTDEQTAAGYMHAGYPVVTQLDIADPKFAGPTDSYVFNNDDLVRRGSWGLFHEMGHNMQRDTWTFDGTVEVTCNIFTLHAMEVITKIKPLDTQWVHDQFSGARYYLEQGAPFQRWKEEPGVALMIYAQVAHHLGWDCYKDVFRQYENLSDWDKPRTTQAQIDQWFTRLSRAAAHNLAPTLDFWGIPFSASSKFQIQELPGFLPDDTLTVFAPLRVRQISDQYPGLLRSVPRCSAGRFPADDGKDRLLPQPTTRVQKK